MGKLILTAPAGNLRTVKAAVDHGADAVYSGFGRFNLRARASSLCEEDVQEAAEYVHNAGREFYIALNTMPSDREMGEIEGSLKKLAAMEHRPDALIISDPGVLELCRLYLNDIPLHLSTQTGTFNSKSASFWKKQGIKRIVLPREMGLDEIGEISRNCGVETEVFIHGAMCVSVSGRCLLGAYISGRHPNRGDCPQPCRLRYSISPEVKNDRGESVMFDVCEDGAGTYLLNSKDLNSIEIIDRIAKTGVTALKIEGRNKSEHYISAVVKTYRSAIDSYLSDPSSYKAEKSWIDELDSLDHRTYTAGFYGDDYNMQEAGFSKAESKLRVVGAVREKDHTGRLFIEVKNPFYPGERLSVLPASRKKESYDINVGDLTDIAGVKIDRAVTNRIICCDIGTGLQRGDILRRKLT